MKTVFVPPPIPFSSGVVAYSGPGNIVTGATVWGGLRAYTAATAGTKAIRIRASGDNVETDINTLTNGNLDVATVSSFLTTHGGSAFVTTIYDKTGNGHDWTQTSAAAQPALALSGLGSLPIMQFAANPTWMITDSITAAQAFTNVLVLDSTTTNTSRPMGNAGTAGVILFSNTTPNGISLYSGNVSAETASTVSTWYSLQCLYSGTNSQITLNGSVGGAINAGTSDIGGPVTIGGDRSGGGFAWTGNMTEIGIWPVGFSSANFTAMSANQRAYWGF